MRRYLIPLAASLVATVAAPSLAAAQDAIVTTDLNMRAGPSTSFPVVDVLPESSPVDVHGCVDGYSWCDVSSRGNRGWVSANYLSYVAGGSYVPLIEYTTEIDIPIITYSVGSYWDTYYRSRPWYHERARWSDRWRDNWRGIRLHERVERRRDRREDRVDRRRDRREDRAERREIRREAIRDRRRDARTERRENRVERRENRAERRIERRREERAERRTERRVNRIERRERSEVRPQRREGAQGRQSFGNQRSTSPRSEPIGRPQRSEGSGERRGRGG
jgi:uncharacterized protein YraI